MKTDKNLIEDNISKILNDPSKVTQIIQSGIRDALLKHKQAGNQICVWRDNKVVWIPPEQIVINE
jgi:hypothetical protein